jgi:hypothetical protein
MIASKSEVRVTVSGPIREGDSTREIRYFVVNKATQAVLGSFVLPDATHGITGFRLVVNLAAPADAYDAGVFNDQGGFVSAGFTINPSGHRQGAVGAVA